MTIYDLAQKNEICFHHTAISNLKAILKDGLLVSKCNRKKDYFKEHNKKKNCIFLFNFSKNPTALKTYLKSDLESKNVPILKKNEEIKYKDFPENVILILKLFSYLKPEKIEFSETEYDIIVENNIPPNQIMGLIINK